MTVFRAMQRVQKELHKFLKDPPEFVPKIAVRDSDMSKVYFLIQGPTNSAYQGGEYVVEMDLSKEYPMHAPVIRMLTPSGRFAVGKSICTTFTNYHPESWSPLYNFSTIIASLVSFMLDESGGVGSISATKEDRVKLAKESVAYNKSNNLYTVFDDFAATQLSESMQTCNLHKGSS